MVAQRGVGVKQTQAHLRLHFSCQDDVKDEFVKGLSEINQTFIREPVQLLTFKIG